MPIDGLIAQNGSAVELSWFEAKPPRVGAVTVKRRPLGQRGGDTWKVISPALGPVMQYTDRTTKAGVAYEYQVLRSARDIVDVGYWIAGVDLPAMETRGNVYLVIENRLTKHLAARLDRFESDLTGDGWNVQRFHTPRHRSDKKKESFKNAIAIKSWLAERYNDDPFGHHAVVLIGHVPLVRSGRANPDGHDPKPHPTDLFFADIDGRWSINQDNALVNNRLPGDFIEMQIGRIDFAPVSDRDRDYELHLLRAYFDKNHHWRMGLLGDLREAYGETGHLTGEVFGLRNIVGARAVRAGGHHDVGEAQPWLWGVDFGHWNGEDYARKFSNRAVFAINFGSGKQRIDLRYNAMIALLAQPWYPLAVGWGGRPAWWVHHMALGGTIGDVHMRTVNNGRAEKPYRETMDYFPTGAYLWRNPIWVNLVGDPTTRAFPLAPPTRLEVEKTDEGAVLSWTASADTDTIGYKVYRTSSNGAPFVAINGGEPTTDTTFTDPLAPPDARFMVRAYGRKRAHAGSFYTYSQGVFGTVGTDTLVAQDLTISATAGQRAALPGVFGDSQNGVIHAVIAGPASGKAMYDEGAWYYVSPAEFAGPVEIRFSVSDARQTDEGILTVVVTR